MTGDTPQDGLPIASRPHGRVFVQLCTEPYTGLPILAAGGHWPGEPADPPPVAEVRYDGVAKSAAEVRPTGETEPDGRPRLQFSTQLPREANVRRVQVVLREGGREEVLFDAELDTIPSHDAAAAVAPPRGKLAKLLGFLRRGWRSLRTGEIFSLWRWVTRARRFRDKLTELRLRLRQKLLARRFRPRAAHDGYAEHTALTPRLREAVRERAGRFAYRPKISILLPVYNVAPKYLREAIESVRAQVYDNWELCIADDASTLPALRRYLRRLPRDPRLKLVRRSRNGHISAASNSAAAAATGEFVALLDHDDRLAPDALYEIVALLQQHPGADLIYSDEDKLDAAGRRYDPQFKPDWSPELLLSYNYINHLTCIRKSVFDAAGRFRLGFEGSQDHDLLLRVIERTDRVFHIPKILYHWRALPSSTASAAGVKPFVHTSGRRALEDYLFRNRLDAEPYVPEFARRLGLPVNLLDWPDEGPSVAVLLLGDGSADLRRCAESVLRRTTYRSYRLVVRTGPRDPEGVRRVLREMAAADPRIDWGHDEDASGPLPARLNRAVAAMTEDLLVFLDPRLEVTEPRWLSRLAGYATLPGVGATGPSVFAADGTRLRAGVVLGMRDGTAPADAFRGLPADAVSYYFYAEVARPVAAVSGACLLTHRRHFDLLGGFDAARFPRSLFDVDYCLRLAERGLRSVYVPGAELRDPEPDGGRADDPVELRTFREVYGRPRDPFYNPNLSEGRAFEVAPDGPLPLPEVLGDPPVRLLVASHNLNNPEGAPRYLSEIVLGLKERGRVEPAVFSPSGGAGERAYREAGVPVVVGDLPERRRFVDGLWSPLEYDAVQRYLAGLLRDRRPEAVLANTLLCFPVIEAAARAGVPSVWVIHESYSPAHMARLFSPYGRARCEAAFALASRVVPASHDTADLFRHRNVRGNFQVLHNGLIAADFDDYLRRVSREEAAATIPGPPGRRRVVNVGTVCERKGQHTLVEAAALLRRRRDDFCCYLVGMREQVPYAGYVRHLIREHGLEEFVLPVAETDNVRAFYRAADVFVCTSHMEAFSRSVLEAEAFGLPVVSTACCGVGEQVFWGANALRFEPGDAAALADHLDRLLGDDALRSRMAERSRAAFDNHLSYAEMLDRYERVVLSVSRHGPRARLPLPEREVEADAPARRAA